MMEEVASLDSRPGSTVNQLVTVARLDGTHMKIIEKDGAFRGEGELVGEVGRWTSWSSTSTLSNGSQVQSETSLALTNSSFASECHLQTAVSKSSFAKLWQWSRKPSIERTSRGCLPGSKYVPSQLEAACPSSGQMYLTPRRTQRRAPRE